MQFINMKKLICGFPRLSNIIRKSACPNYVNSYSRNYVYATATTTTLQHQPLLLHCYIQKSILCLQNRGSTPYYLPNHAKGIQISHSLRKENESPDPEPEKLSLMQRYKKMLKEYWYVLLPVHMVTSSLWFGAFYYAAQSGFDIIPYLEMLSLPESIINPLRNPLLGNIAVASAMYKIATPARYMVTLGGTTMTVKYLSKHGLIKPLPSKDKFKSMIKSKLQSAKDSRTKSDM